MRHIIDQIGRTQAPLDNLANLAKSTAEYTESRTGDMVNPYTAQLDEEFARSERELESSLAARGMLGSTQADEARSRLREAKGRATADAQLKFFKGIGGERRADIGLTGDLLTGLFGQQMEGSQFALDRVGTQAGAVGAAESMDLQRRNVEQGRSQAQYENMLNSLLQNENIASSRGQEMQQPLSMLLSALSGTNVAPGTVGPLQMPMQRAPGPGLLESLGNIGGQVAKNWLSPKPGSDRNIKHDIRPLTTEGVLAAAKAVPVSTWRYDDDPETVHIGPMAQDFKEAFGVGDSDKHIYAVDMFGVALASIQALAAEVDALKAQLAERNN